MEVAKVFSFFQSCSWGLTCPGHQSPQSEYPGVRYFNPGDYWIYVPSLFIVFKWVPKKAKNKLFHGSSGSCKALNKSRSMFCGCRPYEPVLASFLVSSETFPRDSWGSWPKGSGKTLCMAPWWTNSIWATTKLSIFPNETVVTNFLEDLWDWPLDNITSWRSWTSKGSDRRRWAS